MLGIVPDDFRPNILSYLNDILIYVAAVPELLKTDQPLFGLCGEYNTKFHPANCTLFARGIRWCGRLVSSRDLRCDPGRLPGLLTMRTLITEASLEQFICALKRIEQGILNFAELQMPLHGFIERFYT